VKEKRHKNMEHIEELGEIQINWGNNAIGNEKVEGGGRGLQLIEFKWS